jgi:hypothetical protein
LKISAKDIERWAEAREAQGGLPRLIRRLAVQAGTVTEIAFPAGDSVSRPGWDGQILSNNGDPWVPAGRSAWEVSVERNAATKANRDYKKRTQETDQDTRQQSTLVAVTARHWAKKGEWATEKRARGDWKDVRAYDSDDLEAWLEANAAIALAFAEEIGLAGFGVESLGRHWQSWAVQCEPAIAPSVFFADRQEAKDLLLTDLRKRTTGGGPNGAYAIRADSAAEAASSRSSRPFLSCPTRSWSWRRISVGWPRCMARSGRNPGCYSGPSSMPWSSSPYAEETTKG